MRRSPIYGLDIETDTTVDGLDPSVASILTVALSTDIDECFEGPEDEVLWNLDQRLSELPPGVIATWNGSAFDLPFISDRAGLWGLPIGLYIQADPRIRHRHEPLPGHEYCYRAAWHGHNHLDAYRLYRDDVGPALRISCSLKSIARLVGLAPVEVDREKIHDLSHEALHAYASSDARLARVLAERRWNTAARRLDDVKVPMHQPARAGRHLRTEPAAFGLPGLQHAG